MIIRKPYAFLIKYFKFFHFIMLIFSLYIVYKSNKILAFFNEYVSTRLTNFNETFISDNIPLILFLFAFIIVIFSTFIIVLFRKKDKPILFYVISSIYYFVYIILCIITMQIMRTIMIEGIEQKTARLYRDIWLIVYLVQYIFVVVCLVRTFGFDFKKFNFNEDYQKFKIEETDNEEVELKTAFDADRVKMKAAMKKEEFKAFYYENRFIIILIFVLTFIIIPSSFLIKYYVDSKIYIENDNIIFDNYEMVIDSSLYTQKDSKGNILFKNDNYYLIVKFKAKSKNDNEISIDLENIKLEISDNIYSPKTTYYEYFKDIGSGYYNQKISNEFKEYILVYVINEGDLKSEKILRIAKKINLSDNSIDIKYNRISLNPVNIDENVNKKTIEFNTKYKFEDYFLNNSSLILSHYNVKDKFIYNVNNKDKYIVNTYGLVLSITYEFDNNNIDLSYLLQNYGIIRYKINNLFYTEKINNITPKDYDGNNLFFSVKEDIKLSDSIELVIKLRNNEYVFIIK